MQVVYVDVLFAVNLAMDFLALYLTGRLLRRGRAPIKLLAAAGLGGAYGVAALFLEGYPLVGALLHMAVSLLLCYVAYGMPILGTTALFYGISCLLGGAMTALWTAINRLRGKVPGLPADPTIGSGTRISAVWLAVLALLCGVGACVTAGIARRRHMAPEASFQLFFQDTRLRGRGIVDSANFLTEPMSGYPVIVLPRAEGKKLLPPHLYAACTENALRAIPTLPPDDARRVRLVPMVSAGGSCILAAVKPDRCEVDGVAFQVFVAMSDVPRVIIPGDLVKGNEE